MGEVEIVQTLLNAGANLKARDEVERVRSIVRYLKPEYLDEISETCEIEES
jgi:hypothetical protein